MRVSRNFLVSVELIVSRDEMKGVIELSVVFIVIPAVVVSWPILCGAVAGAAAVMGYKARTVAVAVNQEEEVSETWAEVSLEGSEVIADSMKRESEFVIANGEVTARFRRAADGCCTVHVSGDNKTQAELDAIGHDLIGRVTQQYAYHKVVSEMKKQGFTITSEEVAADRTIRVNVSRFV